MSEERDWKPAAAVILAGALWGGISIFIRKLSEAGLGSLQISAVRLLVASVGYTLVLAVSRPEKLRISLRDIWMFIGTGIVSVVMFNICYFTTMIHSQASIAVVLLYTSPVFIMILSALLFKERITVRKLIAVAVTVSGCTLVSGVLGGGYVLSPFILLCGLGSGFFYGLYTIFGRIALKKYDTETVTAYTFIFGAAGAICTGNVGDTVSCVCRHPQLLFWCVGIGVLCTILPYYFYTWGLKRMESAKAAILVAVEPLVGAVIGMTLFQESREPTKLLGICLILAAIILLNLPERRNQASLYPNSQT